MPSAATAATATRRHSFMDPIVSQQGKPCTFLGFVSQVNLNQSIIHIQESALVDSVFLIKPGSVLDSFTCHFS